MNFQTKFPTEFFETYAALELFVDTALVSQMLEYRFIVFVAFSAQSRAQVSVTRQHDI